MLIKKYRKEEESKPKDKAQERDIMQGEDEGNEIQKKLERALRELDEFQKIQKEDEINILCIQIAGLCHNLGNYRKIQLTAYIVCKFLWDNINLNLL